MLQPQSGAARESGSARDRGGPPAPADLLATYDAELRGQAEMIGAASVDRIGPLWIATFEGGNALISSPDLLGEDIPGLVAAAVTLLTGRPEVHEIEWKTRTHDRAPGLLEELAAHGFRTEETESVMIGQAEALAAHVPLPGGVAIRRIDALEDLRRMDDLHVAVFGGAHRLEQLQREIAGVDPFECWIAEAGGEVVSAGILRPVRGTRFAGIWGGGTEPSWRGRGIYRALTSHRARSALRGGWDLMHSDSTEDSRPILERSGFRRVTGTTPYVLRR